MDLKKSIYDPKEQELLVEKLTSTITDILKKHKINPDTLETAWTALWHHVKVMSSVFKNEGFKDEKEWRIIYQRKKSDNKDEVQFRSSDSGEIIPYVDHQPKANDDTKLPIRSIRIGPSITSKTANDSTNLFLEKHGYKKIDIIKSPIPYKS